MGDAMQEHIMVGDLYDSKRAYLISSTDGRVEVRDAEWPNDERLVLGFGTRARTRKGTVFVAYFAPSRQAADEAPEYRRGLRVVVGNSLFDLANGSVKLSLKQGVATRHFKIADGKAIVSVDYRFPLTREVGARLLGDPFNFRSNDICYEIREMAKTYAPQALD
jgi:hypothetical protein